MLCPPQAPSPLIEQWLERHRGVTSFTLHMLGIPLTVLGALMLPISFPAASWSIAGLSLGLFVLGYLLQFLGHFLEGTDPGEIIALKRRLGLPYVEFSTGLPRRPDQAITAERPREEQPA